LVIYPSRIEPIHFAEEPESRCKTPKPSVPVLFLVLILANMLSALLSEALLAQTTAIRAGRLIDLATVLAANDQVILVEGGTIRAVGAELTVPPDATVIDLSHLSVLPTYEKEPESDVSISPS
jgi:hypothetical protein